MQASTREGSSVLDRLWNMFRWRPQPMRAHTSRRQAGVVVSEDTAQTYSAVNACIRIISEQLASLPWQVHRRTEVGPEYVPRHPVQWLLNVQANPEMTAFVARRTMWAHQLGWGMGYAEIERGLDGRPLWLWPLLPDRTCIERSETGALVARVSTDQGIFVLPRENVFILSDGSYDGIVGQSRIQLARRSIGVGLAQDVFSAAFYENGAAIGGVITQKTGKTLTLDAQKALLDTFNEKYAGPARASKTLYVDAGMVYEPVTIPLADAQYLETRRFQVEEIARWYGVPMHLLADLTNANYAISYEATKNFVEFTLRPLCHLAEQEANIRLFGLRAQGGVYSRMNLNGLLRADAKTRGEYYKSLINAGVMSINEVRELEELNSIGSVGDHHYLQTAMTTIDRIANPPEAPASAPVSTPAPAAEPVVEPRREENVIRRQALTWWRNGGREMAERAEHPERISAHA